ILDREGHIVAIFVGTPEDPDWPAVIADMVRTFTQARKDACDVGALSTEASLHCRGNYYQFTEGVSLGGRQRVSPHLFISKRAELIIRHINANKSVWRVVGFQSSALMNFALKMAKEYIKDLRTLFTTHPELRHNYRNSIFPAATYNLGPRTATFNHLDGVNRPDGLCALTTGGDYDHKKSTHLYLEQLHVVVEFPSGVTSLLPSATVGHGNTPLQDGKTRCSLTQYAAGRLFRRVGYGFKTAKQLLKEKGGAARKALFDGMPGERARKGLALFSKPEELAADRKSEFATA
ncbi:hypothetical protein B0H10DRAFT_1835226, partial [Mycena sp. CBHHK59/15]